MRLERPDGVAPPQLGVERGGEPLPAPPGLLEEARHAPADAVIRLQHTCGFAEQQVELIDLRLLRERRDVGHLEASVHAIDVVVVVVVDDVDDEDDKNNNQKQKEEKIKGQLQRIKDQIIVSFFSLRLSFQHSILLPELLFLCLHPISHNIRVMIFQLYICDMLLDSLQ